MAVCEMLDLAHASFFLSDFASALFIFIGALFLIKFLKIIGGEKFRGPAYLIGIGTLFFAVGHEWGEFICGIGVHGGIPQTVFGAVHLYMLGTGGSIMFFAGCYLLQKRYVEYLKK